MTPEERAREIARRYSYRIAPDVDVDDFIIDFLTAIREARVEALEEAAGVAQLIKAAAYKDANEDAHDCAALIEDRIRALKDKTP